jgi:hypothetical protein
VGFLSRGKTIEDKRGATLYISEDLILEKHKEKGIEAVFMRTSPVEDIFSNSFFAKKAQVVSTASR